MEIGSTLQQARLRSGMTLREISNATKISLTVLETIERNDFSRLSGEVFMRGHLRAYAAQVGLDPAPIVNEFREQFECPGQEEPLKLRPTLDRETSFDGSGLFSMLTLGLLVAIYLAFASRSAERPSDSETVEVIATTGEAQVPSAIHQEVPIRPASPALLIAPQGLRLQVQPHSVCWVSAVADGRLAIYRLMLPGERAMLEARDEIQLRVGDAGAFAYLINGATGRPLGRPGEAVSVRITKDNYEGFAVSAPLDDPLDAPLPESVPGDVPSNSRQATAA